MYELASENAASREHVRGPGSFVPTFLDELYLIREASLRGDQGWLSGRARVEEVRL